MEELANGTYVVLNEPIGMCGCDTAEEGNIGVIVQGKDRDGDYRLEFCNEDCKAYAKEEQFTVAQDQEKAKDLFSKATTFNYAKY